VGNKLGWIIAGVLVAALIIVIVLVALIPKWQRSKPTRTTLAKGFMELVTVKESPAVILGAEPGEAGNAGDDYQKAVELYKANSTKLEFAENAGDMTELLKQIHAHVAAGAKKAKMEYTFVHTPKKFVIGYRHEPAVELQRLSHALELLGKHYLENDQYAEAELVYKDELVLGWHMVNERSRAHMVQAGINVQFLALRGLNSVYSNRDGENQKSFQKLQTYSDSLEPLERAYSEKSRLVYSRKPEPGDIFNIVENDKDRAWRVQAILVAGIVRFTAASEGDVNYANELIKKYVDSNDKFEQAAAVAARDATEQDFELAGSR